MPPDARDSEARDSDARDSDARGSDARDSDARGSVPMHVILEWSAPSCRARGSTASANDRGSWPTSRMT